MQGAQKLRSEAHLQVRRNDEVEAQRRRWTFYETIKINEEVLKWPGQLSMGFKSSMRPSEIHRADRFF
jgi:hypothetical protein